MYIVPFLINAKYLFYVHSKVVHDVAVQHLPVIVTHHLLRYVCHGDQHLLKCQVLITALLCKVKNEDMSDVTV